MEGRGDIRGSRYCDINTISFINTALAILKYIISRLDEGGERMGDRSRY